MRTRARHLPTQKPSPHILLFISPVSGLHTSPLDSKGAVSSTRRQNGAAERPARPDSLRKGRLARAPAPPSTALPPAAAPRRRGTPADAQGSSGIRLCVPSSREPAPAVPGVKKPNPAWPPRKALSRPTPSRQVLTPGQSGRSCVAPLRQRRSPRCRCRSPMCRCRMCRMCRRFVDAGAAADPAPSRRELIPAEPPCPSGRLARLLAARA